MAAHGWTMCTTRFASFIYHILAAIGVARHLFPMTIVFKLVTPPGDVAALPPAYLSAP